MKAILTYEGPIEFSENDDGSYNISGVGFSTDKGKVTKKKVKISKKELDNIANTMKGVPLMKDHSSSVDAVIGKVTAGVRKGWDVMYSANLHDEGIKEKISAGLLGSVSVGLRSPNVVELEDGWYELFDVSTAELSVVVHPATETSIVPNFSFSIEEDEPKIPVVSLSERILLYNKYTEMLEKQYNDLLDENKDLKMMLETKDEVIQMMKNEHRARASASGEGEGSAQGKDASKETIRKAIFEGDQKAVKELRNQIEGFYG